MAEEEKSSPGVTVNEKSAAVKPSETPVDSAKWLLIQREEQPRRSKEETIHKFRAVDVGISEEDETAYLDSYEWDADKAVSATPEERRPTAGQLEMQRHLGIDGSTNEGLNLQRRGSTAGRMSLGIDPSTISGQRMSPGRNPIVRLNPHGLSVDEPSVPLHSQSEFEASSVLSVDESSMALTSELLQGMAPPVPSIELPSRVLNQRPNSPQQQLPQFWDLTMASFQIDKGKEAIADEEDVPVVASSQEEIENVPDPTTMLPRVINSRRVTNQQLPQLSDEDIQSRSSRKPSVKEADIPVMASSQEEEPRISEEDIQYITLHVILGTSGQTVDLQFLGTDDLGDVCLVLETRRPDEVRDYFFISGDTFEEYESLDITISEIFYGGTTTLVVVFSDEIESFQSQ